MDIKDIKQLTAPCGMDCFNCPVYEKNITLETKKRMSQRLGIGENEISCHGCRNQNGYKNLVKECRVLNCVKDMKVEFCSECLKFPCDAYNPCSDRAEIFPHNFKLYNLCRIKLIGIENWEKESMEIRNKYFSGKLIPGAGPVLKN